MSIKKSRPVEKEVLITKSFVMTENLFEFGPLLIKKDPERRNEPQIQQVNSSIFQITNSGKYPVEAQFVLKSTLSVEEGGQEGRHGILPHIAERFRHQLCCPCAVRGMGGSDGGETGTHFSCTSANRDAP